MAHMLEAQWFGRIPVRRGDATRHALVDDPLDAVRGIAFATLGSFVLFWLPLAAWISI
jgi:hypothetical protein